VRLGDPCSSWTWTAPHRATHLPPRWRPTQHQVIATW
jgi:hypothetical protein